MAKVVLSARQARALLKAAEAETAKAATKKTSVAVEALEETVAARVVVAKGACVVTRPGRNTKTICRELTEQECLWVGTELQAKKAGFTTFFPGKRCSE